MALTNLVVLVLVLVLALVFVLGLRCMNGEKRGVFINNLRG